MMRHISIITLLFMAGCTTNGAPYGESFIGYKISEDDEFHSCSRENSGIRLGYEYRVAPGWKVAAEYEHVSHLLCGAPFNDKPEDFTDHVGIVVTYGGL